MKFPRTKLLSIITIGIAATTIVILIVFSPCLTLRSTLSLKPTIVLILDGLPYEYVQKMLSKNQLPGIKSLISKNGFMVPLKTPFPSYTGSGLASIWYGKPPAVTGIFANTQPYTPKTTVTESESAFNVKVPLTTFWEKAFLNGQKTVVLASSSLAAIRWKSKIRAFLFPNDHVQFDPVPVSPKRENWQKYRIYSEADFLFDSSNRAALTISGNLIPIHRVHDETGKCAFQIQTSSDTPSISSFISANPGHRTGFSIIKKNNTSYGVVALSMLSSSTTCANFSLLVRDCFEVESNRSISELLDYLGNAPNTTDNLFNVYEAQDFGPTFWKNGNGDAEKILEELLQEDSNAFLHSLEYSITKWTPDLLVHYSSTIDHAGHLLFGSLENENARTLYETTIRNFDAVVLELLKKYGERYAIVVVSDHGMKPVKSVFFPNVLLKQHGFIETDAQGALIPSGIKAIFPDWSPNTLVINTLNWQKGVVPKESKNSVLEEVLRVLKQYQSSEEGSKALIKVLTRDEVTRMGIEIAPFADAFIEVREGYGISAEINNMRIKAAHPPAGGTHAVSLPSRQTEAFFAAGGYKTLTEVRQAPRSLWDVASFILDSSPD